MSDNFLCNKPITVNFTIIVLIWSDYIFIGKVQKYVFSQLCSFPMTEFKFLNELIIHIPLSILELCVIKNKRR